MNIKNKVLCPIVSIESNLSLRDLDPTGNMNCKKIILFAVVSSSLGLLCTSPNKLHITVKLHYSVIWLINKIDRMDETIQVSKNTSTFF